MAHEPDDIDGLDGPDDLALQRLLTDAVADVEPHDRLGEIRRRTAPAPRRTRQRWTLAVLGAGVATASVVGAVALAGNLGLPGGDDQSAAGSQPALVGTYFVGETTDGTWLYREFQVVDAGPATDRALAALRRLEVDAGPEDPDYTTLWPDGSFTSVAVVDDGIRVELGSRVRAVPAGLALQQAVQTVQGVLQQTTPVTFATPDGPLAGATSVRRDGSVVAPVNISDPVEGLETSGTLVVRGRASAARTGPKRVAWELRDATDEVVRAGDVDVAEAAWTMTLDLSDLAPGRYVIAAFGADVATATDTRTFVVH